MLLPSWCAPRRADGIAMIAAGLMLAIDGAGSGRIGAEPGIPAATARGWLRPRAEEMRQAAMFRLGFLGAGDLVLPVPAGSQLGDAMAAVAACAHAVITRHGHDRGDLPARLGFFGLAPAPG